MFVRFAYIYIYTSGLLITTHTNDDVMSHIYIETSVTNNTLSEDYKNLDDQLHIPKVLHITCSYELIILNYL